MKKYLISLLVIILSGCSTVQDAINSISNSLSNISFGSTENDESSTNNSTSNSNLNNIFTNSSENNEPSSGNPSFVRQQVDYTIRDSVDRIGNLYISYQSQLPSVMTFVNRDGTVTVCSSNENTKTTYIYEYSMNLEFQKVFNIQNEIGQLGAFTKDEDGNYYFFYGAETTSQNSENMAMVKYDKNGIKINSFKLKAKSNGRVDMDGIKIPFDAGTCRLALSGSMLSVYFAREMFSGHQASFGFVLDKDTFTRIDIGAVTNPNNGKSLEMPYVSHSFNQFILPVEEGFIFADHGDAYPRCFIFSHFQKDGGLVRLQAFKFPGQVGQNATYAEMGGLAKTSKGYIFTGAYGIDINTARNIFILTFDEKLIKCSNPVYITSYTKDDSHAGHPKIVELDSKRYLILWEKFRFSTQPANQIGQGSTGYQSTYMVTIDENGKALSEIQELKGIRLNMNDVLQYNPNNGKVYWAINNNSKSITVYALDINK
jgi:hypothetical protein